MFSRFVFALVGPESSSSNTVASTAIVISQGKIPWNTPPWLGIEPGPRGGQTVSYPTELSDIARIKTIKMHPGYTVMVNYEFPPI